MCVCVTDHKLQYSVALIRLYMPRISGPATEVIPPYAKGRCLGRIIYVMYELKLYMNALDT